VILQTRLAFFFFFFFNLKKKMAEKWKSGTGMAEPNYRKGNKIGGKTGKVTGKGNPNGQMGNY
jgi:hypothetical protein